MASVAARKKYYHTPGVVNGSLAYDFDALAGKMHARVTALVMDALRKCAQDWLKVNKKGVTLIVPANSALAYSAKIDVSAEILKKLNAVTIDFTAQR